ncbi:MAG: hypothetical protein INH37_12175 [Myxococcaceae bacterium]|nr:hypothetical protein [Myxococcaceae bacterium]
MARLRGTRSVFSALPLEAAPDAGLESLLAYAEQHAGRNRAPAKGRWRRWLFVLSSAGALVVVGVVANRAMDAGPRSAAEVLSRSERERAEAAQGVQRAEGDFRRKDGSALKAAPSTDKALSFPSEVVAQAPEQERAAAPSPDDIAAANGVDAQAVRERPPPAAPAPPPAPKDELPAKKARGAVASKTEAPEDAEAAKEKNATVAGLSADTFADQFAENFSDGKARGAKVEAAKRRAGDEAVPLAEKTGALGAVAAEGRAPPAASVDRNDRALVEARNEGTSARQSASGGTAYPPSGYGLGTVDATARRGPPAQGQVLEPVAEPPPPSAMPTPPGKGWSGAVRSREGLPSSPRSTLDAAGEPASAPARSPGNERAVRSVASVAEALAQARALGAQGDRQGEVRAALVALKAGATGYERVEALKRACDGFEALGQPASAASFCSLLLDEFPGTAAAQEVARRRRNEGTQRAKVRPAEVQPASAPNP